MNIFSFPLILAVWPTSIGFQMRFWTPWTLYLWFYHIYTLKSNSVMSPYTTLLSVSFRRHFPFLFLRNHQKVSLKSIWPSSILCIKRGHTMPNSWNRIKRTAVGTDATSRQIMEFVSRYYTPSVFLAHCATYARFNK